MPHQRKHSEEELIALLREKSERSFNIVYDAYSPALFGIVLKIVRYESVAEDVLQEAFVRIWQGIDSFDRSKGSLFTWMLNIARNHAIDYLRSKQARNQAMNESHSEVHHDLESVELAVDTIGLMEQLDTLAPEYRMLIDLLYFKGYTQKEISEERNIPIGTVKTRIRAAFSQLRVVLKEFQYE